jgi:hypothetical protein
MRQIAAWPRRRQVWAGALLVYAAFFALSDFSFWRPERRFDAGDNLNICEGRSWLHGRLDLILDEVSLKYPNPTGRPWDSAFYNGRVYSHFPPFASMLFTPLEALWPDRIPHLAVLLIAALSIPGLAYLMFLRVTPRVIDAVLLTLGVVLGSSLYFAIDKSVRGAQVWHVNTVLACGALLLFLREYFGQRRIWVAGAALAAAFWSRQLTLAYVLPFAWMAWRGRENGAAPLTARQRLRRLSGAGLVVCVMIGVVATFNWLKFDHPLESGYRYIYVGRDDLFSRDAQYGIFAAHFIPRNLYYMNVGLPKFVNVAGWFYRRSDEGNWEYGYNPRLRQIQWCYLRASTVSTGIWWTSPVLLYLFFDLPRIVRDPSRRVLLLAVALAFAGLVFYHSTGQDQRGYNRYSVDYIPAMMALIAPWVHGRWRRWITPLLIGWSLLYYQWMIPQNSAF